MKGQEENPEGSRPEELWAKWIGEGGLTRREEEELAQAVAGDPRLRELFLQDQLVNSCHFCVNLFQDLTIYGWSGKSAYIDF
jgi:hypothetical protein